MQKVVRRSDGLAVLINDKIYKYFKYVESECEYVLWFKVDKELFQTEEDVYFGAVYVPPANTDYCCNDLLEPLFNELENFSRSHKYVCINGDFNARIAELSDITITDDDILKQLGVDSEIIYNSDNTDILKSLT